MNLLMSVRVALADLVHQVAINRIIIIEIIEIIIKEIPCHLA